MQCGDKARTPALALLAFFMVSSLFHFTIVATGRLHLGHFMAAARLFRFGFVAVSAGTHWAIYGSLLLTFALTLRPGREPLITGMARRMHGPLTEEMICYTRKVTFAWSCFFAGQLAISVTLFFAAPLVAWSFFVNILDLPLVITMFAVEYAIRLRVLRNPPRHSLSAILDMVADARKPVRETAVSL